MFTRKCKCGKEFQATHGNSKYCSPYCYPSSYANYKYEFEKKGICKKCKIQFTYKTKVKSYIKVYCSERCYELRIYDEKICPVCNDKFQPTNNQHTYCSKECLNNYYKLIPIKTNNITTKSLQKIQKEKKQKIDIGTSKNVGVLLFINPKIEFKLPNGNYVYGWYHPKTDLPFYIGMGTGNRAYTRHIGQVCEQYRNDQTVVVIYRDNLTLEGAMLIESVLTQIFVQMGAPLTNQAETLRRKEVPPLELPKYKSISE